MKLRIVELLLVTTVPTMIVAEGGLPSLWLIFATVLGGTLAAGGAHAFNMYIDRDIDALMERTKDRPLVTGEVTPRQALVFAFGVEIVAFLWLWGTVNLLSASLAVSATLFYVFVYSLWLKRNSTANIVIGGARARGLVGGYQHARLAAGRALRHHLLLDPTALLGPGDSLPRRLPGSRRADAASGEIAQDHRHPHHPLHLSLIHISEPTRPY